MRRRTVLEFPCPKDLWSQVEAWAAEAGFTLDHRDKDCRHYRKGYQLLIAPTFVEIRKEGKKVVLETWVKADFFLILSLLKGERPEMGIESGGMTASVPRWKARQAVNQLLARFGQDPVT